MLNSHFKQELYLAGQFLNGNTKSALSGSFNIYWLNALFITLAICGPWFNLTISSNDLVKSYFASFGIGILMLLSFFYKCNNAEVNLKINYIKFSFLFLFVLGTCSVFERYFCNILVLL